jgi:hypothetical protein
MKNRKKAQRWGAIAKYYGSLANSHDRYLLWPSIPFSFPAILFPK